MSDDPSGTPPPRRDGDATNWFREYTGRLDSRPTNLPLRCPCCFCRTLDERAEWEICRACGWEDDGQDDYDADQVRGGPNRDLSLTAARASFRHFGAIDEEEVTRARVVAAEELPDDPVQRELAMQAPERVVRTLARRALRLIARCEVAALVSLSSASRLSAADIWRVLREYGRSVLEPPIDSDLHIDLVRTNATTPTWSVDAPLWTEEEGRSDLTLQLTIAFGPRGPQLEIDDLHVL